MIKNDQLVVQNFLAQVQVQVLSWGYLTVWPEWQYLDYVPNYNKFYFICAGEGSLTIDGHEYTPQAGQWFWMPNGVRQSYSATRKDNLLTKYWCHFTAMVGDVDLAQLLDIPHFVRVLDPGSVAAKFERLLQNCGSDQFAAPLSIKSALLDLIADYLNLAGSTQLSLPASPLGGKLQQVVQYIDRNLDCTMTVDNLARIVHLHPNYFSRIFRNHLGQSPIQYINRRRIDKAGILILTTSSTLSEIARQVGIHDIYYFSKQFKEQTGYAPSEYRRLHRF